MSGLRAGATVALVALFAAGCRRAPPPTPREELRAHDVQASAEGLLEATRRGDLRALQILFRMGLDPNAPDPAGRRALPLAAELGRRDVAHALLTAGADPNAKDLDDYLSPLFVAIRRRDAAMAEILLARGANPSDQDDRWSMLMFAAFLGEAPIVRSLLARQANVNAANEQGMTALMFAAGRGHAEIVRDLVAHGADLEIREPGGHTALHFAANNGSVDSVRVLLEAGASRSVRARNGETPASYAAANGHREIAALLGAGRAAGPGAKAGAP